MNFPYDGDTVYLAHCFPYSCRDLQEFLDGLEAKVRTRKLFRRRVLTKTIANNDVEVRLLMNMLFATSDVAQVSHFRFFYYLCVE